MPRYPGFIGGTYTNQALAAAGERCVNLYAERYEQQGSAENPAGMFYVAVPGYKTFATLPTSPCQHLAVAGDGTVLAIAGGRLYELRADGSSVDLGGVAPSAPGGYYRTADNGRQVLIVHSGSAWLYDYKSSALSIVSPDEPIDCGFIDGYFLTLKKNSRQINISALVDGKTWDALDFAVAEGAGDNILAMFVDHRELWLFGKTRTEVFYDSGNPDFPFERLPGGYIEQGIVAPQSSAKIDNSLVWLGGDPRGQAIVWRANGYTPVRLSNHAVEWIWSQYARIDDAVGYSYQDAGHQFYVLHFPSANPYPPVMAGWATWGVPVQEYAGATWVYDVSTGLWHERAYWDQVHGVQQAHRGRYHIFAFGKHLLGDHTSGKIYEQDAELHDFDGQPRRWLRSAPYLTDEGTRSFYSRFELHFTAGQGAATGQGQNPVVRLSWSNDGGFTWSDQRPAGMGAMGQYAWRAFWNRLGSGRKRCFAVTGSDPVRTALIDSFISVEAGQS